MIRFGSPRSASPGVATCPTTARHFGDFNDPESNVSRLVRERGGFDLAPELGYRPTSKYLPSRPRRSSPQEAIQPGAARIHVGGFLRWVDRALSR
jgi:Fe-S-cluster-containing dehydrogenase component